MRNWDVRDEQGNCSADSALEDASFVCNHLDIELHEVNFVKEYWNNVFRSVTFMEYCAVYHFHKNYIEDYSHK